MLVCMPPTNSDGNLCCSMQQAADLEQFLFGAGSAAAAGFGREKDTYVADAFEVMATCLLSLEHTVCWLAKSKCKAS